MIKTQLKIIRILVLTVMFMSLSSCVLFSFKMVCEPLIGQPIETAVQVLGYPNEQQRWGNDEIYLWIRSASGVCAIPQTSTSYQQQNGSIPISVYGGYGGVPVYGTVGPQTITGSATSYQYVPTRTDFVLKLGTDAKTRRIKNYEYSGPWSIASDLLVRLRGYYFKTQREQKAAENAAKLQLKENR